MATPSYNNSLPPDLAQNNIENRNFLSPVGFRFAINKMRGVDFFCQAANIPAMSTEVATQGTRFNAMPHPGDELKYDPLTIKFLVDENMKNYYQVHDWMRELATPVTSKEFTRARGSIKSQNKDRSGTDLRAYENQWRSDCSLFILSSNYKPVAEFVFRDAFPVSLSTLNFDSGVQDIQFFTAQVTMAYSYFDYFIYEGATATDASMTPTYRTSAEGVVLP